MSFWITHDKDECFYQVEGGRVCEKFYYSPSKSSPPRDTQLEAVAKALYLVYELNSRKSRKEHGVVILA